MVMKGNAERMNETSLKQEEIGVTMIALFAFFRQQGEVRLDFVRNELCGKRCFVNLMRRGCSHVLRRE